MYSAAARIRRRAGGGGGSDGLTCHGCEGVRRRLRLEARWERRSENEESRAAEWDLFLWQKTSVVPMEWNREIWWRCTAPPPAAEDAGKWKNIR